MISVKRHLSRRTILRGLSTSIALPLLDAMVPAHTLLRKTAAAAPTRFLAIEMVHGAAGSTAIGRTKNYWSPVKEGRDFDFTYTLAPLEPLRDYLTVISDTELKNAMSLVPVESGDGADHARSSAVFLTAAHPKLTAGEDIQAGPSIDQLIAARWGGKTRWPSLQLCIEDPQALSGECGHGYSCQYTSTISWASPTRPLPMERSPRAIFERLFGRDSAGAATRRPPTTASALDETSDNLRSLRRRLGGADRGRVADYLDEIRAVERRIQEGESRRAVVDARGASSPASASVPDSFDEHADLLFELQRLALRADLTRVCAFKMGADRSARVYPESGITTPFHAASHHREDPQKIEAFATLNRYHVNTVARFLRRLRDTSDADGNLLDRAAVLYGSPMGDSHVHDHRFLPLFIAGRANGRITGNRHVRCAEGTPMANVLLTLAHTFDLDIDRIGDSTGEVAI
jgi:Protein of unknown function (DUF1552)